MSVASRMSGAPSAEITQEANVRSLAPPRPPQPLVSVSRYPPGIAEIIGEGAVSTAVAAPEPAIESAPAPMMTTLSEHSDPDSDSDSLHPRRRGRGRIPIRMAETTQTFGHEIPPSYFAYAFTSSSFASLQDTTAEEDVCPLSPPKSIDEPSSGQSGSSSTDQSPKCSEARMGITRRSSQDSAIFALSSHVDDLRRIHDGMHQIIRAYFPRRRRQSSMFKSNSSTNLRSMLPVGICMSQRPHKDTILPSLEPSGKSLKKLIKRLELLLLNLQAEKIDCTSAVLHSTMAEVETAIEEGFKITGIWDYKAGSKFKRFPNSTIRWEEGEQKIILIRSMDAEVKAIGKTAEAVRVGVEECLIGFGGVTDRLRMRMRLRWC